MTAACTGLADREIVYGVGVLANFWNPVGWFGTAAMLVVDGACFVATN